MAKPFLTAAWRNLLMANYTIDPLLLQPYLPYKTELDTFNGTHYVSLIGFLFDDVRLLGVAVPFHTRFEEINLRFYVRYKDGNEWKRGVVFIKEIVPRHAITLVANTLYKEKYVTLPTRHEWLQTPGAFHVKYEWKIGGNWNHLSCTASSTPLPLQTGSAEEFITEHYWGYTRISNRSTGVYQVAHPRWRVHTVSACSINCSVEALYGAAFQSALSSEPSSVFLAEGSYIEVLPGTRIVH